VEKRIIVALDFNEAKIALNLVDSLDPELCRLKVGKELYTACGPDLLKQIQDRGFEVFLDLKFHDIPNTVAKAVNVAGNMGVWMLNVHASGGQAMMEAAREALLEFGSHRPKLIAVTVLTSLAQVDLHQIGIECSPAAETRLLRAQLPKEFCLVTPGIRRATDATGDQKRVLGPADAVRSGSNYLVVGRPITQAKSPSEALFEFNSAIASVS
jgi:orotidine-5'-phosphate decarboxylase